MSHIWIVGWVQFSINEAEAAGEITPEHVEIFETCVSCTFHCILPFIDF
jgi:hypothetical protein